MSGKFALGLICVWILVAACRQEEATPTVAVEAMAQPEQPTPTPSSSSVAPTPTQTALLLAPTLTPFPTATERPQPTETATPTAVVLMSEADFGGERNPLTGELVPDLSVLQRRPIAVKISNSPAEYVRPQAGIGQADLVFEHATEGPITRFTAVIYGQTPPDMGPIRSARLIDVEIPAMYDAALAFSGSSIGVSRRLFGSDFRSRILRSSEPGYYRTGEDKPWEHTLHGDPEGFWQALEDSGENRAPSFGNFMSFNSEAPPGGEPASGATIRYRDWTVVEWRFDEESGRYRRWADGLEHLDANNGQQISAANVVLVFAIHVLDRSICEFQSGNQCLAFSTEIQIWGQGPAIILRDGLQYSAVWKREQREHMLTFWDNDGNPLPLQLGNSWFQVVPLHYEDPVSISP